MDFASIAKLKVQAARAAKPKPPPVPLTGAEARLQQAWDDLDRQERALKLEQKYLSEIWLTVCDKHKENEAARAELEQAKRDVGVGMFVDPGTPIRLNVGGLEFETTAGVLCRDEYSILAAMCRGEGTTLKADGLLRPDPPGSPNEGSLFIDRDWWIFRHILQFLRSGTLPEDPSLVEELYAEATFYRLGLLRQAVEKRSEVFQRRAAREAATSHQHQYHHHPAPGGSGPFIGRDHRVGLYDPAHGCGCGGGCAGCSGHGHSVMARSGHHTSRKFQDRTHARTVLPDPFGFTTGIETGRFFSPQGMR